jgi:hypothetical protein
MGYILFYSKPDFLLSCSQNFSRLFVHSFLNHTTTPDTVLNFVSIGHVDNNGKTAVVLNKQGLALNKPVDLSTALRSSYHVLTTQ